METDIKAILAERGSRYGTFAVLSVISQNLHAAIIGPMSQEKYDRLAADQKEALQMIAHKLARIINGDPDYSDSWRDVAGFATLVAGRLDGVAR